MRMQLTAIATAPLHLVCNMVVSSHQARADLIPIRKGQPFGTLIDYALNPSLDANALASPVINNTDDPVIAVYNSDRNVIWMSDQRYFLQQYNANIFFLSTLVGKEVDRPDGSHIIITANEFFIMHLQAVSLRRSPAGSHGLVV